MNFNNVSFEAAFGSKTQLKKSTCPEVVFSGRSNVGKSSLINKLVNRKALARVSTKPGKTGTINFYDIDGKLKFVDLPGYGYAKVSAKEKARWSELVEGYFNSERNISLVVQLVDMRHKPTADDLHMIEFLQSRGLKFVVVLTKSDKLNKTQREERLAKLSEDFPFDGVNFVVFSSVTGEGVEEVMSAFDDLLKILECHLNN